MGSSEIGAVVDYFGRRHGQSLRWIISMGSSEICAVVDYFGRRHRQSI